MFGRNKRSKLQHKEKPKPASKASGAPRPKLLLLPLESRLMFDAAAAATASEVNQEQVAQEQAEAAVSSDGESQAFPDSQDLLQAISTYMPVESRQEIVFVDPTVPNHQELLSGIDPDLEVIMLDGGQDGIQQMANALAGRTGIDAIHLISHGDQGQLSLGTGTLTQVSMTGQYADELAMIKQALSEQADILVYGCEFAEGQAGREATTLLGQLTGADVAASTDLTGAAALGGDWILEVTTGTIESDIAITAEGQAAYADVLDIMSGLTAQYAFEEGSGTTATDTSGNNRNGTLVGEPTWTTGQVETGAMNFGGDFDRVEVADAVAPNFGSGNFSVGLWLNSTQTTAGQSRLIGDYSSGTNGFLIYRNNTDLVVLVQGTSGSATLTAAGLFDGNWHQVVTVRNGTTFQLFVDGQLSSSTVATVGDINNTNTLRIGASSGSTGDYDGRIDDVRMYTRALTSGDVAQLYATSNDAPINVVPGAQTINEDTNLVFSSGNGNQISITDPDAGGGTFEVTIAVTNGTLTLSGTSGLTFVTGDGTADSTMTVRGTVTNINAGLNGLSYSPTTDYAGGASLTISTTDSTLVSLNLDASLQARYTFNGHANDAAPGTAQNGTLMGNAAIANDATRGQVLSLDGADDYADLTTHTGSFSTISQGTLSAWVNLTATGERTIFDIGDGAAEQNFVSLFVNNGKVELMIMDGGTLVLDTVSTASVNDGNWHHIAFTVDGAGNQLYIDGAVAARTFNAGSSATVTFISSLNNTTNTMIGAYNDGAINGEFLGMLDEVCVYNRALSASEVVTLAGDLSLTDTDTVAITVNAVNDGPSFTSLNGTPTHTEGGSPVVLDSTVTITDTELTGANNFNGAILTLSRNGGASSQDVFSGSGTLSLSGGNVVVGGTTIGTYTNSGGTLAMTFNGNATNTLVNSAMQQITYSNSSDAPPSSVQVNWTFNDGNSGSQGTGGALAATGSVTVSITAVNDAPTDLSLSANTVAENASNGTVIGTVSGTDPDTGDTKTYSFTDSAGGRFAINSSTGVITVANGGLLNYESATSHSVTVRVTDSGGLTYDETFTINLTNVNEAPTGADATVTINEDTTHTFTTANFGFSDVDAGDSLSAVRIDTLPGAGTLRLSGVAITVGQVITAADITAGNLVFTPAANANGTGYASFAFSVRDSNSAYDTTPNTLTFDVTPVNDAPVLSANTGSTVAEGGTDTIGSSELAVTDVDNTAAQLAYTIGTGPAYGRLELTTAPGLSATTFTQADIAANRLVYVHDGAETTSDSFSFTVNDGAGGAIGSTTVTLTIIPMNDTPTITSNGGTSTAAINVAENVSAVTIVTGADVDLPAQALTYSISGGVDQALFTIDAVTGALNFTAPPDFEVATDANGDNVYVVQVRVIDSQGASTTQAIQVTVTDVVEGLPLAPATPPIPPVLLSTAPSHPIGSASVPSSPSSPAEPPPDAPPSSPILPGPRSMPSEFHQQNAMPIGIDSLANRSDARSSDDLRKPIDLAKDQPLFINDETGRPQFTLLPVEPAPVPDSEPPEESRSVSDLLLSKLDEMTASLEQAMGVSQERHVIEMRIAALTGTTLSAGFIAWALRSGALLASFMATMPVWRHFDPLPVLGGSHSEHERRRKEAERDQQAEATEFKGLKKLFDPEASF